MRYSAARQIKRQLTLALVLASQLLWLIGCSLPTRPTSPTDRYGQVSVTLQTNAAVSEDRNWPLMVIRSVLTREEHFLRRQKAAVVDSIHYSGRIPPGRYRLLGLVSDPTLAARKLALTRSLGSFDVLANEHCQLGQILHWQPAQKPLTRSLRPATEQLCWNADDQDRQRARQFVERQQTLSPPASLGSGPVLRHSGLLSYRRDRNQRWQVIDSGAVRVTAAAELSPDELLIGGEQGLLLYRSNNKQQRLPLQPSDSVVLALIAGQSGVSMLISTAESLQLLHSNDIHNAPWQTIVAINSGYQKIPASDIQWSVTDDRLIVTTVNGKQLLTAELTGS